MTGREVLIADERALVTGFIHEVDPVFLQAVAEPVDRFAGVIRPEFDQFLLHVAARVAGRHRDVVKLADLRARLLLIAGVDRAEVAADPGAGGEAVDTDHLAAVFSGRGHREHAARAAADDENIRGHGLRDIFFRDLRSLAEPVAGILFLRGFLRHDFNGDLTLRLGDALRGGLPDSA